MKKFFPKGKLYTTHQLYELEVSYTTKGQHYKISYLFDNTEDITLFSNELISLCLKKGFQNLHVSVYQKELHKDSGVDTNDIKAKVVEASSGRRKRLESGNPLTF